MDSSEYIKNITVDSYMDLADVIHNEDIYLREYYVFRGLEDLSYDLVSPALRVEGNN